MKAPQKDPLALLLDGLIEEILAMDGAAIQDEAAKAGLGPESVAATRARFVGTFDAVRLARLKEARAQREVALVRLNTARSARIPAEAADRRALLMSLLAGQAQAQPALTLQFRDLQGMSDADVESALEQLASLGLLDRPMREE